MAMQQGEWTTIPGVMFAFDNKRATLGGDPELKHMDDGTPVAEVSLAVNHYKQDEDGKWVVDSDRKADWYQATVYGAQALNVVESLRKGNPVLVSGRGRVNVLPVQEDDGTLSVRSVRSLTSRVQLSPDLSRSTVEVGLSVGQQARQSLDSVVSHDVSAPTQSANPNLAQRQAEWAAAQAGMH